MNGEIARHYLQDYLQKTDPLMVEYLTEKAEQITQFGRVPREVFEHFVGFTRKGKKIRGALTVLGYLVVGGDERNGKIYRTSLVMELFHAGFKTTCRIMTSFGGVCRRCIPYLWIGQWN
jgi:geranylgeranyl pyrophosphate synthase